MDPDLTLDFESAERAAKAKDDATGEPKETKEQRAERERDELVAKLADYQLDTTRTKVAYILNQHPASRNSDVELAIQYWSAFHRDEVGDSGIDWDALRKVTPMASIIRARAHIQNKFKLFKSDEAVESFRDERQGKVRRKARAEASQGIPLVHVYADESGKSGSDPYYIVGSMWINNADEQLLRLGEKLREWRKTLESKSELKFVNIKPQRKQDYLAFVRQALSVSEYVGFKAIILAKDEVRSRPTDDAIYNLYYRLIVDGIHHEVDRGRFSLPRGIVVKKDADEGADKIYLNNLRDRLRVECPGQFDNQVYIQAVTPLTSSQDMLIQFADVFTGSINRVINRDDNAPRNHKDEVAEELLSMMGGNWRNISSELSTDALRIMRL